MWSDESISFNFMAVFFKMTGERGTEGTMGLFDSQQHEL